MNTESYTDLLLREFARLKDLAERALTQIDDDAFFATLGDGENTNLPRPQYRVVYVCDTSIGPLDAYRALALELGLERWLLPDGASDLGPSAPTLSARGLPRLGLPARLRIQGSDW